MNRRASASKGSRLLGAWLLLLVAAPLAFGQADVPRQTVAITYPLDQTVNVKFRGTTRLPRLKGEAKVRRAGRRGTRVELSIENLPRAQELGGVYTTYILWAISPEGRVDNLGEIKRSGSMIVDSKLDVTTPLQNFALIVTAEPHFLVRGPSRMVVLENLPPRNAGDADVATMNVQYAGNSSDYFNDQRLPEVADNDYGRTPTSLLGARQAVNLARYAGAEREAQDELREAQAQLEEAENAWRLKQSEAEVDAAARKAVSLGARAEEMAETRRAARQRREEISRRDAAVREAEETAATAGKEITDLRADLERERHARELAERDAASATQQLRDLRTEVARLRDELQSVRAEGEEAKVKLARIEGERQALAARQAEEQRATQQRAAAASLKETLARFGSVRETNRGLVLVLPESVWANARASQLAPAANAKLEPLAALLANNPDYRIVIESYTDNRGDEASLLQLTEERAQALAQQFITAGVDGVRIQASGMGVANPVAPNNRAQGRLRNRRTEITLTFTNAQDTAVNQ
ncbi:MAG TPA: OmpA family protein [Pyrinomonadaceae bacterium]|jgi:outer membrane protein OmpA-like peptidoglycan-associated protein|nr:OmpA family protein [Pyrinomonadaceae bacterium]